MMFFQTSAINSIELLHWNVSDPWLTSFVVPQGNSPVFRGSEIADHAAVVKPNGGPAAYPEAPAATHVLGKTPKRFEDIILSMAQVNIGFTPCAPDAMTHTMAMLKHADHPQSAFQSQTKYLDTVNVW